MIRIFDYATIVNVVDGDTCDIEVDLGFSVKTKLRFRLAGIDTPERGDPGWDEAKQFLAGYIGVPVLLASAKLDKYGRYLATITSNGVDVNALMLSNGLAKVYGT